uniref:uncharacterized protein LOC122608986 n=1 Tax=Erigeron canadensis TaxID=72917 RepID=UPI001CB92708|nr:uncharacterized protein LOC122608986 [Erigeron canadensis]
MSIDKSWISLDHRDKKFWSGLAIFIERCKDHMTNSGKCRCPCEVCDNFEWQTLEDIRIHIHENGFSKHYKIWRFHGEPVVLQSTVEHAIPRATCQLHDLIADVRQENHDHEHSTNTNDPMNTNDDPMNTTNDLMNTTNDPNNTTDDPNNTTDELAELLKLAKTDLYPGSKWVSALDFLAKLSHMKAVNKWADSSFDQLLEYLRFVFPDAKISESHYEAKKKMKTVGLGYELIDVCRNNCCIFWGEDKEEEICKTCSASRRKDKNTKGKKVPNKVMRYFPLTPRLKRLYNSRHTAQSMTWHATGQSTEVGKMRHPVDGTTWKDFDARYPDFASEPKNVRLRLAADGFNPFGNMSVSYSMWSVIMTTYNMPPWLCMKESTFMLTLLILGPRSPRKDMDVFLRPLIDELKSLWSQGVKTNDAATKTSFTMRAMLL